MRDGLAAFFGMDIPTITIPPSVADKVRPNAVTGCWEWIGARDRRGYGNVRDGRRVRKAHRVVYELVRGPIAEGLECDHLCRVPWCVNPHHVELVAHAENVQRGAARWVPARRQRAKRRCPRGHPYTRANTYVQPSTGGRACRVCDRERKRVKGLVPLLDANGVVYPALGGGAHGDTVGSVNLGECRR